MNYSRLHLLSFALLGANCSTPNNYEIRQFVGRREQSLRITTLTDSCKISIKSIYYNYIYIYIYIYIFIFIIIIDNMFPDFIEVHKNQLNVKKISPL